MKITGNNQTKMAKANTERVRIPILIPLGLVILALLGAFVIGIYRLQYRHINMETRASLNGVQKLFAEHLKEDAQLLNGTIDFLKKDDVLQNAWLAKDRAALLRSAMPILKDIHSKYDVTHFYFHDPNKVCFLRVHNPFQYGDYIERFTLDKAAREEVPAYGIELGPFGTFVLRSVHPWLINGKLAGYIELGEEIGHITSELKDILHIEVIFVVNKSFLNRTQWEEGLKMISRTGNWDTFPEFVVIDTSLKKITPDLSKALSTFYADHKGSLHEAFLSAQKYQCGFAPLFDAGGREAGKIIVMKDISKNMASLHRLLITLTILSFITGISLTALFYLRIRHIEHKLTTTYKNLKAEVERRMQAEKKLQKAHSEMETQVKERTAELAATNDLLQQEITERKQTTEKLERSYSLQKTLNSLLSTSLQDLSLEDMLEHFIEEIVSVPILSVEPKGAILLVEDEPQILVMKAHRGLAKPLLNICAKVHFGHCMCGLAAASGKIEFADCVDARHTNQYEGISPHGHYCVPIISSNKKTLGVINLYTKANRQRSKEAEDFLCAIADVLAGTIQRKKVEVKLKALNLKLQATAKELAVSNQDLRDFMHIAAHDLKSPLRAMGTLTDWILTDYGDKLDEQGKEQIKLLKGRVWRMSEHIDGVLRYSEIGRVREKQEKLNLDAIIKEAIARITPPENIKIVVENTMPAIFCEKIRITQVFQNLLGNAVRYMDKPQGIIKIGCTEENGFWKFSVADNGPGIEEKYFEKIFKIFQTLSPRDKIESTGVGLSIVKRIVELYGGSIWVSSTRGQGSTFFFTLPKQKGKIPDSIKYDVSVAS